MNGARKIPFNLAGFQNLVTNSWTGEVLFNWFVSLTYNIDSFPQFLTYYTKLKLPAYGYP